MYWDNKGSSNSNATIAAALRRGEELGIKNIVVASNSGDTAAKLGELAGEYNVVCVTHHVGFKGPGEDEMAADMRNSLKDRGMKVLTTTHLLAGMDRGLQNKFQGACPPTIVASTLRMFGQGMKVCVEISVMALDAGLIPYGEEIIAIAGSSRGADSSCVILPAHSNNFFDTVIKEIICMPREK